MTATTTHQVGTILAIPLHMIDTAPQIRTRNGMDRAGLRELADSIIEHGLQQPIIVRPVGDRYEVVAGHRRHAACKLGALDAIPAIVRVPTDDEKLVVQIIENIQREDLTLIDTANAVRQVAEQAGGSSAKTAAMLKKSKSWVSKHLALTSPTFPVDLVSLMDQAQPVNDIEVLHGMRQIDIRGKAGDEDAAATYRRLLKWAQGGEISRATVRAELERLKAASSAIDSGDEDSEEDGAAETLIRTFTLKLEADDAAKLRALGGVEYLRKCVKRAKLPAGL